MLFKVLLILSIIIQFGAATIAIKMIRRTRFNSAWILSFIAMLIVNSQLIFELVMTFKIEVVNYYNFMTWSTILMSLCLSFAIFYLEKIISYIEAIARYRRMYDKKIISAMISAEENERQRIAKDLHDGLGPLLSSAKMSLSYINNKELPQDKYNSMMIGVADVIDESIHSIREISNNLSPNVLNNFGLIRAMNNFINKLPIPPNIHIDFNSDVKCERFNPKTEIILFRICCELINNAIKHSQGDKMELKIERRESDIYIFFSDNGKGFDYKAVMAQEDKGFGLSNIKSRIGLIDGSVEVDSSIGNGTKTHITVPIRIETKIRPVEGYSQIIKD